MPTYIDRIRTDVTVEPEPESDSDGGDTRWQDADRLARLIHNNQRLEMRTRAEGFDD